MTTPDLQALIELSDDATPGEWRVSTSGNDSESVWQVADLGGGSEPVQVTIAADIQDYCRPAEDDAEFICALVNWFRANHSTLPAPTLPGAGGGDAWDAARLDWLEQFADEDAIVPLILDWKWNGKRYGAGLRAAIDAALPPQQGG